jgi:hypothetical protein
MFTIHRDACLHGLAFCYHLKPFTLLMIRQCSSSVVLLLCQGCHKVLLMRSPFDGRKV